LKYKAYLFKSTKAPERIRLAKALLNCRPMLTGLPKTPTETLVYPAAFWDIGKICHRLE